VVSIARRGEGGHRNMAAPLQRSASAFEPGLSHAERVRGSAGEHSAPSSNGPGRCGIWASAPWPVAPPAPQGAQAGSKGRRLKLAVVRRNEAGHSRALFRSPSGRRLARPHSVSVAMAPMEKPWCSTKTTSVQPRGFFASNLSARRRSSLSLLLLMTGSDVTTRSPARGSRLDYCSSP
jgi:hypothetical protein